jgi:hypothetical protein
MIADKVGDAAKRFFHSQNALLPLFARPGAAAGTCFTGSMAELVGQPRASHQVTITGIVRELAAMVLFAVIVFRRTSARRNARLFEAIDDGIDARVV